MQFGGINCVSEGSLGGGADPLGLHQCHKCQIGLIVSPRLHTVTGSGFILVFSYALHGMFHLSELKRQTLFVLMTAVAVLDQF